MVAAADTVTARNSSRASGGGSSTTDGGLVGNAPEPVGILFICYDSIAKTTTIARCSFPTNTNTNGGGGSGNRNRGHYCPTPRRHPSPVPCHSPTPTQRLTPTAAVWLHYNTTHHHADHAIARRPRPSSIAATEPVRQRSYEEK